MSDTDDLLALQQAVQSVQDMRAALREYRQGPIAEDQDISDRIATTEVRREGFYWVILGHNPPEIAYWERGEWWLAGDPKPWQPEAVTVASDRLVFRPRLAPVA
jgi:hypothetical protein